MMRLTPALLVLMMAAPAAAETLRCRIETMCDTAGTCRPAGSDEFQLTLAEDGQSISLGSGPEAGVMQLVAQDEDGRIFTGQDDRRGLDVGLFMLATDLRIATAGINSISGGPRAFANAGRCEREAG